MFESDSLTAKQVLEMFLNCSDEKVLELYHNFMQFMEEFCRFNDDTIDVVRNEMNERRTRILGYESKYSNFYMYDAMKNGSIDTLEFMLSESGSKAHLMQNDFKTKFLESEIIVLKQYILKCYAMKGEDKITHEVSKILAVKFTVLLHRSTSMLMRNGKTLAVRF